MRDMLEPGGRGAPTWSTALYHRDRCKPAPPISPRCAWTTRWRCSTNSCARPRATPTPPRCAAWSGASPSGCRSSPATGARSRAARARSASGWRGSSSTCATSRAAGWTCRTPAPRPRRGRRRAAAASEPRRRRRRDRPPQDDDERFIVGLVLTYYRRHPQRARTRLLDLLGEVLTPRAARRRATAAPRPHTARRPHRLPAAAGRGCAHAVAAHADRRGAAQARALSAASGRRRHPQPGDVPKVKTSCALITSCLSSAQACSDPVTRSRRCTPINPTRTAMFLLIADRLDLLARRTAARGRSGRASTQRPCSSKVPRPGQRVR